MSANDQSANATLDLQAPSRHIKPRAMHHIRWRRGFFRLWIIVSVMWGALAAVASHKGSGTSLAVAAQAMLIPPLATLALGIALGWIASGFVRPQ
jgi:uncharacterized membrane protein